MVPTPAKETQTAATGRAGHHCRPEGNAPILFVWALRCKHNENFVQGARVLCLATLAETRDDHYYIKYVLTKEQTVQYWANLSTGGIS